MISGITNNTLDTYMMAMKKSITQTQKTVLKDAVSATRHKENVALDNQIIRNNLLSNITFLKDSDKAIFAQNII